MIKVNTVTFKDCSKCKKQKPLIDFYKWGNGPGGHYPSCKECKNKSKKKASPEQRKIWHKRYYLKNRDRIIERTKNYPSKSPSVRRKVLLKHQYGISEETYKTMEISQEGKCAICFQIPVGHVLFVDHCHKSKKIRGLLCRKCNAVLGMCSDDEKILQSSINYLRRF